MKASDENTKIRLDKWLWAARFFKTRSLAGDEIDKGRVRINGQPAKASREPKVDDEITFTAGHSQRTVVVRALSAARGPAPQAALLYEETAASLLARAQAAERHRLAPEPAHAITQGRPTKRDRRQLQDLRSSPDDRPPADWNARWSAALDD
ncbi:RNA-binding S4 domain-containing protein [Macromonas nakdongensis]|uniref:RNA-binding S4 domain-containing protein n=1 Tax=Macromonas nakdongensis TaxID=1843082 RepID=UPI000C31BF83|nr:RNA-binding S4 domain-containing protein [Macromonas nakdongensis]